MFRPLLLAAAVATLGLTSLAPAQAAVQGTVIIQSGPTLQYSNLPPPPPPRMQHRPSPRRGHVWVQGHWEWRGNSYRWVDGYWLQMRRGYDYRQPNWVQSNGQWRFESGGWHGDRDMRDHGGRPNRYDRNRDGDGLRNDRDRDRDGVPNRYDRHPNNPRRN
ncbi:MAG: YXWGXW repeat-containing protein [Giesbergeria sp.]